ncbi:MAG: diaminopimelate decarboxylase [Candidatus Sumerlaeia bacterium]|nr:diaminopimelate decarboxylase [Candidatus Sumerlaeia bacterium]
MTLGFDYIGDALAVDGVSLADLAGEYGTPLYVYSAEVMRHNYRRIERAFAGADVMIAYSVKSNSNLAVLKVLKDLGAGFDIVSGGELIRTQRVGIPGERVIFAGVGKTEKEISDALDAGVSEFNVESEAEAERINAVAAARGERAPVAIRINPNIDAKTHKYITTGKRENKFGISMGRALELAGRTRTDLPNLDLIGIHCHIGSQILDSSIHPRVVEAVVDFARKVMDKTGQPLKTLNFGGGFGIAYEKGQTPLDLQPFADALLPRLAELKVKLLLEPGRSIAGPAGVLLTRVEYIKKGEERTFAIVDAAMTELLRPTLYEAHHEILPVHRNDRETGRMDVVGPVCETGDFLALDREGAIPHQGDLLAVMDAGAYGFVMSSTYNARPRPAEILIDGGKALLARRRETHEDLLRAEDEVFAAN